MKETRNLYVVWVAILNMPLVCPFCLPGLIKAPDNSIELYTVYKPERNELFQMFLCKFGYEVSSSGVDANRLIIYNWCVAGNWHHYPDTPICHPRRTCGRDGFWSYIDGRCLLKTYAKGWEHSSLLCDMAGSRLMVPTSSADSYLYSDEFSPPSQPGDNTPQIHYYWLGMEYDVEREAWIHQATGETITWTNWQEGDNQTEKMVATAASTTRYRVAADKQGKWKVFSSHEYYNQSRINFGKICEKVPDGVGYETIQFNRINIITNGESVIEAPNVTPTWNWVKSVYGLRTKSLNQKFVNSYPKYLQATEDYLSDWENMLTMKVIRSEDAEEKVAFGGDETIQCSQLPTTAGKCAFKYERDLSAVNPLLVVPRNAHPAAYVINSQPFGVNDVVFTIVDRSATDGYTSWSVWTSCWCNPINYFPQTLRFRVDLKRRPVYNESSIVERKDCSRRFLDLLNCHGLPEWAPWSRCSSGCGEGTATRRRLCQQPHCHEQQEMLTQRKPCMGDCNNVLDDYSYEDLLNLFPDLAAWLKQMNSESSGNSLALSNIIFGIFVVVLILSTVLA